MKKLFHPLFFLLFVLLFFYPTFLNGKLPMPSDTIVGLYHPFRDYFSSQYPNGIPFKNFLITDPVRQQFPWRYESISQIKEGSFPFWNPYNGSGTPLFGNLQSAVLYPFNLLSLVVSFPYFWTVIIFIQPLLSGLFFYLYVKNLGLKENAALFGALVLSFCGFFIAWLEWGTVLHVALWLPLTLLSIDKINNSKGRQQLSWGFVCTVSLVFALYAGYLQTFFYLCLTAMAYLVFRSVEQKRFAKVFIFIALISVVLSSFQFLSTFNFIVRSERSRDLIGYKQDGWFIPWENSAQFIAPDFFGNPATLNYWGVWNYAELVGYIGVLPLIMALSSIFDFDNKEKRFFTVLLALALVFAFPTPIAKLPFEFNFPFISTSQPTRLIFVIDFCLAVLAAYGFDKLSVKKFNKQLAKSLAVLALGMLCMWGVVILKVFGINPGNLTTSKSNLVLPTILFLISALLIFSVQNITNKKAIYYIKFLVIFFVAFDLFRFGWKFTPFTDQKYLFPTTSVIKYLEQNLGDYRFMVTDSRIFPPNFNAYYKLQSLSLYDPLYLKQYGMLIAASERGKADISEPFGFNRIIDPHSTSTPFINLFGVKYILSFDNLGKPFRLVYKEGNTKVFLNPDVLPRVFFVERTINKKTDQDEINQLFEMRNDFEKEATISYKFINNNWSVGKSDIISYKEGKVVIKTLNSGNGFLILTDSFYNGWKCFVDGKPTSIYKTDFNFRGIVVPKGNHTVEFVI